MSREPGTCSRCGYRPGPTGGFGKSSSVTVHGLLLKLSRAWPLTANAVEPAFDDGVATDWLWPIRADQQHQQTLGDPRVNIQNAKGKAEPYQMRQVLQAIDKLEGQP